MDYFTNKRLLILALGLLILLNIGTILTIWLMRSAVPVPHQSALSVAPQTPPVPPVPGPPPLPPPPPGIQAVMASELGLTPRQEQFFNVESERFMHESRAILRHYSRDKKRMLEELASPKPDTLLMGHLTAALGHQQTQLERIMIRYVMNLRKACTPEQLEKFPQIIHRMLITLSLEQEVGKPPASAEKPTE